MSSGFFYLVNHGVDPALLDEAFAQSKKFFSLPLEEKEKVLHDKNHRGYTPFEEEVLDPETQSKGTYISLSKQLLKPSISDIQLMV